MTALTHREIWPGLLSFRYACPSWAEPSPGDSGYLSLPVSLDYLRLLARTTTGHVTHNVFRTEILPVPASPTCPP